MSLLKKALLQSRVPILEARRFRGKINLQRPRKPHFERQLLIDVSKPFYKDHKKTELERCSIGDRGYFNRLIDNPFERILARECLNWFNNSKMVAFLHMNSITMEEQSKIYVALRKQDMHLRTYGRKIVSMATTGTQYEAINKLFTSHQNVIFSQNDHVGKMLKILKKAPQMVVLAGIVNDQLLSRNELVAYSQLPSLESARAQLCGVLQSAGSGVVGHLTQHQQQLLSHLDQHATQLGRAAAGMEQTPAAEEAPRGDSETTKAKPME